MPAQREGVDYWPVVVQFGRISLGVYPERGRMGSRWQIRYFVCHFERMREIFPQSL